MGEVGGTQDNVEGWAWSLHVSLLFQCLCFWQLPLPYSFSSLMVVVIVWLCEVEWVKLVSWSGSRGSSYGEFASSLFRFNIIVICFYSSVYIPTWTGNCDDMHLLDRPNKLQCHVYGCSSRSYVYATPIDYRDQLQILWCVFPFPGSSPWSCPWSNFSFSSSTWCLRIRMDHLEVIRHEYKDDRQTYDFFWKLAHNIPSLSSWWRTGWTNPCE